jgi:membrane associated rhomboid family serine protease
MAFSPSRTGLILRTWWLTTLLIGINLGVFAIETITGVDPLSPTTLDLLRWGANFAPLTLTGDEWRLLSNMFLHVGIIHLLVNCWALYAFGVYAEFYYGRRFYLGLYLLSGLMGSLLSIGYHYAGSAQIIAGHIPVVSAGASGAIMGLGGALIIAAWRPRSGIHPTQTLQLNQLLMVMAINIGLGLSISGIDNAAHLGGALTGAGLALIYSFTDQSRAAVQQGVRIAAFVAILVLGSFGLSQLESRATELHPLRAEILQQIANSR